MIIYYENSFGEKLALNEWPIMIQDPENIFGYTWTYSSNAKKRSVYAFNKQMNEKSVVLSIFADSKQEYEDVMNRILEITEKDILAETQGRLYVNGSYMNCCVVASDIKEYEEDFYTCDKTIKLITADGVWIEEYSTSFRYSEIKKDISGRGYPYGYTYDYTAGAGYTAELQNIHFGEGDCLITIYGYARNPEIVIGDNIYRLDYTIQAGETVYIDTKERKVRLQKKNGIVVNLFRYRDKNNYIFNKIQSGTQAVYWNGNFDFDVLVRTERGEPRWM